MAPPVTGSRSEDCSSCHTLPGKHNKIHEKGMFPSVQLQHSPPATVPVVDVTKIPCSSTFHHAATAPISMPNMYGKASAYRPRFIADTLADLSSYPPAATNTHGADLSILRGYMPPSLLKPRPDDVGRFKRVRGEYIALLKRSLEDESVRGSDLQKSFLGFIKALAARWRALDYRAYAEALFQRGHSSLGGTKRGSIPHAASADYSRAGELLLARSHTAKALIKDFYGTFETALGKGALDSMHNQNAALVHAALAEVLSEMGERSLARSHYLKAQKHSTDIMGDRRFWLLAFGQLSKKEQKKQVHKVWAFVRKDLPKIKKLGALATSLPGREMSAYAQMMGEALPAALRASMSQRHKAVIAKLQTTAGVDKLLKKTPPAAEEFSRLKLFALKTLADVEGRGSNIKKRSSRMKEIGSRVSRHIGERYNAEDRSETEVVLASTVVNAVMNFATERHGPIERNRYSKKEYKKYTGLADKTIAMGRRFYRSGQGKIIKELNTGLIWARDFDASLALRRYRDAVNNLRTKILPEHSGSMITASRIGQLKKIAAHWFDENGGVKSYIDVSGTSAGRLARARESASYKNNGTGWGTFGSSAAGTGLGALGGCLVGGFIGFLSPVPGGTLAGCKIGMYPGGALGGAGGVKWYQGRQVAKHSREVGEAAALGFTLVGASEAAFYNKIASRGILVNGAATGLLFASPALSLVRAGYGAARWGLGGAARVWAGIGGYRGALELLKAAGKKPLDWATASGARLTDWLVTSAAPGRLALAGGSGARPTPMMLAGGGQGGARLVPGAVPPAAGGPGWQAKMWQWLAGHYGAFRAAGGPALRSFGKGLHTSMFFGRGKLDGLLSGPAIRWMMPYMPRTARAAEWAFRRKTSLMFWPLGAYSTHDLVKNKGSFSSVWTSLAAAASLVSVGGRLIFGLDPGGTRVTSYFYLGWEMAQQWQSGGDFWRPDPDRIAVDVMFTAPMRTIANLTYKGMPKVHGSAVQLPVGIARYVFDRSKLATLGTRGVHRLTGWEKIANRDPSAWMSKWFRPLEHKVWERGNGFWSNKGGLWQGQDHIRFMGRDIGFGGKIKPVQTGWGKLAAMFTVAPSFYLLSQLQKKFQKGDAINLTWHKFMAYAMGAVIIFPLKAPFGMDTPLAEIMGRGFYTPFQLLSNEMWPKYVNHIPAHHSAIHDAVNGRFDKADERLSKMMVQLNPRKGLFASERGSFAGWDRWYHVNDDAIKRYTEKNGRLLLGEGAFGYEGTEHNFTGLTFTTMQGAQGYLKWVDHRIAAVASGNVKRPVLMRRIVFTDLTILEQFIRKPMPAHAEWNHAFRKQREQLIRKARSVLHKHRETIAKLRSLYTPRGLMKVDISRTR